MKILIILFLALILLPFCQAACEEGQIDINSASAEELEGFTGIGTVKAEAIIDYRESKKFESVDELIEVSGIGPVTLENMKNEGACVSEENSEDEEEEENGQQEDEEEEEEEEQEEDEHEEDEKNKDIEILYEIQKENKPENITLNVIKLNTKNINSEDNKENSDKNNYAKYGFVIFCVLLCLLFVFKRKRFKKDELA